MEKNVFIRNYYAVARRKNSSEFLPLFKKARKLGFMWFYFSMNSHPRIPCTNS